ncbi:hypothetical protein [Paenibacillus marinisediminis]
MYDTDRTIAVFAPNAMGVDFVRSLKGAGIPVAAVVNNAQCDARMKKLGVKNIWRINTSKSLTDSQPSRRVGRIYLFETSFALTCRLLKHCRPWTTDSIVVITKHHNPRSIYQLLGADMVLYTQSEQVSFLLTDLIS